MASIAAQSGDFDLPRLQRLRRWAVRITSVVVAVGVTFVSFGRPGAMLNDVVEGLGPLLILVAITGRIWCTLYIGGRKGREVVAAGPYSISRNPLYLFSFIGVFGVGAQTGSLIMGPLLVAVSLAIFLPVIRREEAALSHHFGPQFDAYRSRVPRFGPRLSMWTDVETVSLRPRHFWRTLGDSLVFLAAIPYIDAVEWLQTAGYLKPLLQLP